MRPVRLVRFAAVGAVCGLVLVSALAATNTVSASRAERDVTSITADQKKPKPTCNGITVTAVVTGGANGGNADELVLVLPRRMATCAARTETTASSAGAATTHCAATTAPNLHRRPRY